MIYDISDKNSAIQSLQSLAPNIAPSKLGCVDPGKIEFNATRFLGEKPLLFTAHHITTSSNGCMEIKSNGLLPTVDALMKDTELSRYLYDVYSLSIKDGTIRFDGKPLNTRFNDPLSIKIESDNRVNAYLYLGSDIDDYDIRPEILFNCTQNPSISAKMDGDPILEWSKDHKPFVVTFNVSILNVSSIGYNTFEPEMDFHERMKKLFALAQRVVNAENLDSIPICLNENIRIPKDDIIRITPFQQQGKDEV